MHIHTHTPSYPSTQSPLEKPACTQQAERGIEKGEMTKRMISLSQGGGKTVGVMGGSAPHAHHPSVTPPTPKASPFQFSCPRGVQPWEGAMWERTADPA